MGPTQRFLNEPDALAHHAPVDQLESSANPSGETDGNATRGEAQDPGAVLPRYPTAGKAGRLPFIIKNRSRDRGWSMVLAKD